MFSYIWELLLPRWRYFVALGCQILQLLSRTNHSPDHTSYPPDPSGLIPWTPEQRARAEEDFISAIDEDAVRALASEHRGLPCRILGTKRGSFNICYFISFDTNHPTWVVRVPIQPAINRPWEKLQSEVYTMQLIPPPCQSGYS